MLAVCQDVVSDRIFARCPPALNARSRLSEGYERACTSRLGNWGQVWGTEEGTCREKRQLKSGHRDVVSAVWLCAWTMHGPRISHVVGMGVASVRVASSLE
jgi:hypothetical protein